MSASPATLPTTPPTTALRVSGVRPGPLRILHRVERLTEVELGGRYAGNHVRDRIAIQAQRRAYQDAAEARPDPFIRSEYVRLLDASLSNVSLTQ
jgi:hypothetical protein